MTPSIIVGGLIIIGFFILVISFFFSTIEKVKAVMAFGFSVIGAGILMFVIALINGTITF